jgi:nucleotide-binding universal stress UspA family protein
MILELGSNARNGRRNTTMSNGTPVADTQGERRVVVGVDGSDYATRALNHAAHEAAQTGAILQIVCAFNIPSEESWFLPRILPADATTIVKESLERARRIEPDVVTKGETNLGLPGEVLVEMAEGASSLVVGTRGLGHAVGLDLGSVSEYVLRHAPCTTTVVR